MARTRSGWQPHPTEAGAFIHAGDGLWHTVLPGRLIRAVVGRRPLRLQTRKPGQRKPWPAVEAVFTTDLTLSLAPILARYRERWAVAITLRDCKAFAGFGHDQGRNRERVGGTNPWRLVLVAARTRWWVEHTARIPAIELRRSRPWYRRTLAPSQLDSVWT